MLRTNSKKAIENSFADIQSLVNQLILEIERINENYSIQSELVTNIETVNERLIENRTALNQNINRFSL